MVVRVIDPKPDESVVVRATCNNCGVKVEYVPNDLKDNYSSDYLGDKDYYQYVSCPSCNKEIKHRPTSRFW